MWTRYDSYNFQRIMLIMSLLTMPLVYPALLFALLLTAAQIIDAAAGLILQARRGKAATARLLYFLLLVLCVDGFLQGCSCALVFAFVPPVYYFLLLWAETHRLPGTQKK